jgi:hypothetical protein
MACWCGNRSCWSARPYWWEGGSGRRDATTSPLAGGGGRWSAVRHPPGTAGAVSRVECTRTGVCVEHDRASAPDHHTAGRTVPSGPPRSDRRRGGRGRGLRAVHTAACPPSTGPLGRGERRDRPGRGPQRPPSRGVPHAPRSAAAVTAESLTAPPCPRPRSDGAGRLVPADAELVALRVDHDLEQEDPPVPHRLAHTSGAQPLQPLDER